ncbi:MULTISPECIES: aspartate-alanine antiporter [unclassified Achromobacter]|uniref:aspartate-alanine antiporter n=1 Tax=unclassified Achromobacter TaxID=2626865 RepID=UPI001302F92C|nr:MULTISPECIES: aspartate-alanine antiporter [unclassified Achromobacter]
MSFDWIVALLRRSPEMALFLAVPIGYVLGSIKIGNFSLGTVTGALIVGLAIGQAGVAIDRQLRWSLFYLFLFANGYSAGPQFFQALKRDGLKPMVLSLVIVVFAVALAVTMGRLLGLDPGLTAGLFGGALTQSSAMGTATDAIMNLPVPPEAQRMMINHIAVADALTYVFGAVGSIFFLSVLAPMILRVDLRKEAALLQEQYGMQDNADGRLSGYRQFAARAYRISPEQEMAGLRVGEAERKYEGYRYFVERIHRGDHDIEPTADAVLLPGDVVVVQGRTQALVNVGPRFGSELNAPELLDFPVSIEKILATQSAVIGPTLGELLNGGALNLRSVGMRSLTRGGHDIPFGLATRISRGDVVELVGPTQAVQRVAAEIGHSLPPPSSTKLSVLGFGVLAGLLVGLPFVDLGVLRLTLGSSVGVLLAGLLFGWLRTRRPALGEIPQPVLDFLINFGLAAFVAGAGLQAGPDFVRALKELGIFIVLAGVVVTWVPLLMALLVGRYIMRMNPLLLLGGLAGAQTFTAALAAVQEKADSRIPVLGYTVPYATSNILLTTCGAVVVVLAYG